MPDSSGVVPEKPSSRPSKLDAGVPAAEVLPPHLVDLGKAKPKAIKDLKNGRGKLLPEVAEAIEEARASLGEQVYGKSILPIIVVVEKRRRKGARGLLPLFG